MTYKKKLIEVALPLEAINKEAAREKSIRHGHPSTLHLWWARRPLAACRAVLFASLVDDPSAHPDKFPTEAAQEKERQRLFRIIEDLVKWENSNNERVLSAARYEIARSVAPSGVTPPARPDELLAFLAKHAPPVYDPFCGGGSIPLEAQRLGLEAHASDLNPVAVLINKALIEIPPKFAGRPPVNPVDNPTGMGWRQETANKRELTRMKDGAGKPGQDSRALASIGGWKGAAGLAADIRYYGQWMRDEAEKRIGHLYPKVKLPKEHGGGEATVIAWLWARTVASPNPAAKGAHVPLVRSFWLSTAAGKKAWVNPVVDRKSMSYRFEVHTGDGEPPVATVGRTGGLCLLTGSPMPLDYIRAEGRAGRLNARLMAIVADGKDGRVYLPPNEPHEEVAINAEPIDVPETLLAKNPRDFKTPNYGMTKHRDLFTKRQLVAMTTFCDLVSKARLLTLKDSGHDEDYAAALATYLALASSRCADYWSSICGWHSSRQLIRNTFARQAIPMVWDYAETNPLSNSAGNFSGAIEWVSKCAAAVPASITATAIQGSAGDVHPEQPAVFSTDPPYYDNVGYADLSDYFYIWIRRSLASVYPELFKTVLVPKAEELIADPYRQGGKDSARTYFENGMRRVLEGIRKNSDDRFPTTIFYAFKQTEADEQNEEDLVNNADSHASTGWETFLEGLVESGWQVDGTWPMRTELGNRMIAMDKNALASSIVLVCRPRPQNAGVASRRDFLAALKRELPEALRHLQRGNIAPVDLAQAAIGPGMAVFSRYAKVLETDGSTMSVRSALAEINKCLDEVLAEQEGEFDADTRWALAWFDQNGFNEGAYGVAETLCTAKNTSVQGMKDAGILEAKGGKVRLLKKEELDADWNPAEDSRLTIWEITHHLIRRLEQGESGAAELIQQLGAKAEIARDLSYRLYTICERRKWAQEAIGYNALVLSWSDVQRLAEERKAAATPTQGELI